MSILTCRQQRTMFSLCLRPSLCCLRVRGDRLVRSTPQQSQKNVCMGSSGSRLTICLQESAYIIRGYQQSIQLKMPANILTADVRSCLLALALVIASATLVVEPAHAPQPPASALNSQTKLLWPMPTSLSLNQTAEPLLVDPCSINYTVSAVPDTYVKQIIGYYLVNVFKCSVVAPGSIRLSIGIRNASRMVAEAKGDEQYSLTVRVSELWELSSPTYVGFLRGLETFFQLFEPSGAQYIINGRPILIDDTPMFHHRGLMLDSSRHFLPLEAIKHQIDALMYNKMSVLHWHITDEDSFPLALQSRPELAQYGQFSGTYSTDDIKQLINYAKVRGVRIIPEFDTPAHTDSWGRSPALRQIIVKCNSEYQGQFDPTLNLTYEVVNSVMKEVNDLFPDGYVHFGGDEIVASCYDKKPSIKQWMIDNKIPSYFELEVYYRRRQKELWRKISPAKKAMYWANRDLDLPVENDDVIHWWGLSKDTSRLEGRSNQVVLSNYDLTYLDVGFGGRRGAGYGTFISWRSLYTFEPRLNNVNVIGGQTCMWSEVSNQEVNDQKIWPRTAVLNERLWNPTINGTRDVLNIAQRLITHNRRLKERGFKVSPVTVGLCQRDPSICWQPSE